MGWQSSSKRQKLSANPPLEDLLYLVPYWWKKGFWKSVDFVSGHTPVYVDDFDLSTWRCNTAPVSLGVFGKNGLGAFANGPVPKWAILSATPLRQGHQDSQVVKCGALHQERHFDRANAGSYEHLLHAYSWGDSP